MSEDSTPTTKRRLERDMTRAEIEAATENPDVDWGFIDCGPRSHLLTLWRRVSLWCRTIGREWEEGYRLGPVVCWQLARGMWPWGQRVKRWGIVADRRS